MDHIDQFFSRYLRFQYDRMKSSSEEFVRLCRKYRWRKDENGDYPPESETTWADYRISVVMQFNASFGDGVDDNEAWGILCSHLGVDPIPRRIRDRRRIVVQTHVNLLDLLDTFRTQSPVHIFESEEELRSYTIGTGRYLPKEQAYAGPLLKWLLREIHNEYHGIRGKANGRKSKKGKKKNSKGH